MNQSLCCRSWTRRFSPRCDQKRSRRLRLSPRFPTNPLTWWRYWIRNGHFAHFQDPRRVSGSYDEHLLCCTKSQSFRHCGWTLQRHLISPSTCRKHRWDFLHWQWSLVWHLLQNIEINHTHLWRFKSSCLSHYERCDYLSPIPWSGNTIVILKIYFTT